MIGLLKKILADDRSSSSPRNNPFSNTATPPGDHSETLEEADRLEACGKLEAAAGLYEKIFVASPSHAHALFRMGLLKKKQGAYSEATEFLLRAAETESRAAEAYHEAGQVYELTHELDEALYCYQMALHFQPDHAPAHSKLVHLHLDRHEKKTALDLAEAWAEQFPHSAQARRELAKIYADGKRFDEALEQCRLGLELEPENTELLIRHGDLLYKLDRLDEALESLEMALRLDPGNLSPRIDLGWVYRYQGRFDDAAREFNIILQHEPQNFSARWGLCQVRLCMYDFAQGWDDYAARFMAAESHFRPMPFPIWKGEHLEGKKLLIYAEQGLGDEIMFASCLPDVIGKAGSVLLECNSRLGSLFHRSFPNIEIFPANKGRDQTWLSDIDGIDLQVPIGGLPRYLRRTLEAFPRHTGYLHADSERVRYWKERLEELGPGLKIGFSWRGGTSVTRQISRTMSLETCLPIFRTANCQFVNLQYGDCQEEMAAFQASSGVVLNHWQEAIDDYDETAALVTALDLVVSVCTSLIHLTGALGKPVWIMAPKVPEWRYGVAGEAMPWYPSSRIFRQPEFKRWEPVVAAIAEELAGFHPSSNGAPDMK
ncbi:MAG TPA: tetratricopeptide repeat protein [Methylococcaceae bacterium]|nr:tetratricopeptide repeat protein [Methylococcaceae bacterium]